VETSQKLADQRLREFRNENVAARPLEVCKLRIAAEDEALIRQAGDCNFYDRRMHRQTALDFNWQNVLTAGDTQIVPTSDEKVAVRIFETGIAAEIPAIAHCLLVRSGRRQQPSKDSSPASRAMISPFSPGEAISSTDRAPKRTTRTI
jgi:hypothetical protein